MRVSHNIPALVSWGAFTANQADIAKAIRRLSTGLRVATAADDAAALAVSEKMRAQTRGLDRAEHNAQDGISMIQTAEGAFEEVHSLLQRMRELSVQAANDTTTREDRAFLQLEVAQLREEIDRIGNTTQFNKKKLLDGSASALWSSSDASTRAVVNGGLRETDRYGQKAAAEGNYKITIDADPGQGEVSKTNILKLHENPAALSPGARPPKTPTDPENQPNPRTPLFPNVPVGPVDYTNSFNYEFLSSMYAITWVEDTPESDPWNTKGHFGLEAETDEAVIVGNLSMRIEYDEDTFDPADPLAIHDVNGWYTKEDGSSGIIDGIDIVVTLDGTGDPGFWASGFRYGTLLSGGEEVADIMLEVQTENDLALWGDALYIFDSDITGDRMPDNETAFTNRATVGISDVKVMIGKTPYYLYSGDIAGKKITLKDVAGDGSEMDLDFTNLTADQINDWANGVYASSAASTFAASAAPEAAAGTTMAAAGTTAAAANTSGESVAKPLPGEVAHPGTLLMDIAAFSNSEGRMLLDDPQTITVTQGDGRSTEFTIYADDTIDELVEKLNDAIGYGLGQLEHTDTAGRFARFVLDPVPNTAISAHGTIVVNSAVSGEAGRLFFSGDEELMKALGLNVIRQAEESRFEVLVEDAHTGALIARESVAGNRVAGAVHENVDVIFDSMSDMRAVYNELTGTFDLESTGGAETILHLADNTTVFQIGANAGEDMGIDIGDMRVGALGLNSVLVADREAAARSVTVIDEAVARVSRQRANLGAYQNRLEHTINNLTVASTNMTASESRIRDTDMAKEMLTFTKLNILLQSVTAMSVQANQLPQAVLSLMR